MQQVRSEIRGECKGRGSGSTEFSIGEKMEEDSLYEEKIKEMYVKKGMSVWQIRDALNISKSMIYRTISRYKLKHETQPTTETELTDAFSKLFFEPGLGALITDTFRPSFDSIYESALRGSYSPTNEAKEVAIDLQIDQKLVEIAFKQFGKDGRMKVIDHCVKHPEELRNEENGGAFI